MLTKRIIPCLDVKDGKVVKGVNFVGLKEVGDPVELAKKYYLQGADELVFLDITATHEHRDTMVEVVRKVAKEIFMPFTVGGGIRTIEDMRKMLLAGADTSMDADATKAGFDLDFCIAVRDAVSVPVIASGGCGSLEDFYEVFASQSADAALAASLFHYDTVTIEEVKCYLQTKGVPVRL